MMTFFWWTVTLFLYVSYCCVKHFSSLFHLWRALLTFLLSNDSLDSVSVEQLYLRLCYRSSGKHSNPSHPIQTEISVVRWWHLWDPGLNALSMWCSRSLKPCCFYPDCNSLMDTLIRPHWHGWYWRLLNSWCLLPELDRKSHSSGG